MAYTAVTLVPDLEIFQWSNPTSPNPRLAAPLSSGDTAITFTAPPLDRSGVVVTGNFIMGVTNKSTGYTENIYVPPAKMSADGLTASDVIRGVRLQGLDYTTGDSTLVEATTDQDSPVFCNVAPFIGYVILQALTQSVGMKVDLANRLTYSADGVIQMRSFADAAARDAALTAPDVGDMCFLEDTEIVQVYITAGWDDLAAATASSAKTGAKADAAAANGELYRSTDDSNSLYYKDNAGVSIKIVDITTGEISAGALPFASQVQAEAGTSNVVVMSPLRTEQAIVNQYAAKGDIVVGTGPKARATISAGDNGQALVYDDTDPSGFSAGAPTQTLVELKTKYATSVGVMKQLISTLNGASIYTYGENGANPNRTHHITQFIRDANGQFGSAREISITDQSSPWSNFHETDGGAIYTDDTNIYHVTGTDSIYTNDFFVIKYDMNLAFVSRFTSGGITTKNVSRCIGDATGFWYTVGSTYTTLFRVDYAGAALLANGSISVAEAELGMIFDGTYIYTFGHSNTSAGSPNNTSVYSYTVKKYNTAGVLQSTETLSFPNGLSSATGGIAFTAVTNQYYIFTVSNGGTYNILRGSLVSKS